MHIDADLVDKLHIAIKDSEIFNNPFNNWIRGLDIPYLLKISLVKSGGNSSCYPCDSRCTVNPRRLITKSIPNKNGGYLLETSDGKEDERCFSSCTIFPIDIKYLTVDPIKQMKTYLENRFEIPLRNDFESHRENEPLYRILTPELFVKPEKPKENLKGMKIQV